MIFIKVLQKNLLFFQKGKFFSKGSKGQAWFTDFAIGMLLFAFTLAIYFGYTNNFSREQSGEFNDMMSEAKSVSSSLVLAGYPSGWNNANVARIGIADEYGLNVTKLKALSAMRYNDTKKKLSTRYEYSIFFEDESGNPLTIGGICGAGYLLSNISYSVKSAYYYSDEDDKSLKGFMNSTFNADIYFGDNSKNQNDIDSLINNITKYKLIIIENAGLSTSKFNSLKSAIEPVILNGSLVLIGAEIATSQGKTLAGTDFYKESGQSTSDRNSTINGTDEYLSFFLGENIVFSRAYYVHNSSGSQNFKRIATFNKDGENALSRWEYGNGTVYFFSDFNTSYIGDYLGKIKDATKELAGSNCTINLGKINPKELVKNERYLEYNSRIVKMVVYLWR